MSKKSVIALWLIAIVLGIGVTILKLRKTDSGEANTDRRIVSATGVLHREPGRALRFSEVSDFRLVEQLSLDPPNRLT